MKRGEWQIYCTVGVLEEWWVTKFGEVGEVYREEKPPSS
jgi:hypothetical protein